MAGKSRVTNRGERPMNRISPLGRAIALLVIAAVVALGAAVMLGGVWLDYRGATWSVWPNGSGSRPVWRC